MSDDFDFDALFGSDKAPDDPSRVRARLESILHADPRLMKDEFGHWLPLQEMPEREALAVERYTVSKSGEVNIKLYDKNKAADQIARMDGLYKADNEQKDPLQQILSRVPRGELIRIVQELRVLNEVEEEAKEATIQ